MQSPLGRKLNLDPCPCRRRTTEKQRRGKTGSEPWLETSHTDASRDLRMLHPDPLAARRRRGDATQSDARLRAEILQPTLRQQRRPKEQQHFVESNKEVDLGRPSS